MEQQRFDAITRKYLPSLEEMSAVVALKMQQFNKQSFIERATHQAAREAQLDKLKLAPDGSKQSSGIVLGQVSKDEDLFVKSLDQISQEASDRIDAVNAKRKAERALESLEVKSDDLPLVSIAPERWMHLAGVDSLPETSAEQVEREENDRIESMSLEEARAEYHDYVLGVSSIARRNTRATVLKRHIEKLAFSDREEKLKREMRELENDKRQLLTPKVELSIKQGSAGQPIISFSSPLVGQIDVDVIPREFTAVDELRGDKIIFSKGGEGKKLPKKLDVIVGEGKDAFNVYYSRNIIPHAIQTLLEAEIRDLPETKEAREFIKQRILDAGMGRKVEAVPEDETFPTLRNIALHESSVFRSLEVEDRDRGMLS